MATEDESKALIAWKKYRIMLNRITLRMPKTSSGLNLHCPYNRLKQNNAGAD
ncbi:tail fiber assembly protein [Citrobacter meridianamericanus]|uniref:tail fiber assembly protein n=1 Tax=Citrobacter meridianamericanus TaxID=2894201 RepID=UPI00164FE4F1|nr:tail fiber assembly protein [Citrobacter freundii]